MTGWSAHRKGAGGMELVAVGLVVTWIVLGLVCWLGYLLFLQHGRFVLRIEELEALLGPSDALIDGPSPGLVVGSVALDFELADLSGSRVTLSQWRGRRL